METKRIAIFLNRRRDKELAVTKTVVECIKIWYGTRCFVSISI